MIGACACLVYDIITTILTINTIIHWQFLQQCHDLTNSSIYSRI